MKIEITTDEQGIELLYLAIRNLCEKLGKKIMPLERHILGEIEDQIFHQTIGKKIPNLKK